MCEFHIHLIQDFMKVSLNCCMAHTETVASIFIKKIYPNFIKNIMTMLKVESIELRPLGSNDETRSKPALKIVWLGRAL